jgi:hypothetical protein
VAVAGPRNSLTTETLRLSAAKDEAAAKDTPMTINAEKINFIL